MRRHGRARRARRRPGGGWRRVRRTGAAAVFSLAGGGVLFGGAPASPASAVAQEIDAAQERRLPEPATEGESGSLLVRLVSEDGHPVTGGRVAVHQLDGFVVRPSLAGDPTGEHRFDGLLPGRYEVRAEAPGHRPGVATVRVEEKRTVELRVVLHRRPVTVSEIVSWIHRHGEPYEHAGRSTERVHLTGRPLAAPTLADWLSSLPGVAVRSSTGGRQVVSVRGSRPEAVLVLLDGIPLNDPVTGVADLTAVPVSTLESATLVRGAVAEAGAGGLAGVLVLRSRQPGEPGVSAAVETGSFGRRGADVFASAGGALGSLSASLFWEMADNDFSFTNRAVPGEPRERRRNADVQGRHASLTASATGVPLTVRLRTDKVERGSPGRMGTEIFDRARWEERGDQAAAELGRPGGASLRAGYRHRSFHYRDPRAGHQERQTADEIRVRGGLPLRAGLRASGHLARGGVAGDGLADGAVRLAGGFGLAGDLAAAGFDAQPSLELEVASRTVAWNPSISVVARPGRHWMVRGRAGRALRLPTFGDLYFASAHRLRPNPDLRAERVTLDAELGATWRSGAADLEMGLTAFHRRTRDPIVWLASAAAVWSPRNLDRLTAHGVEVDARWQPSEGWRFRASGTWDRSRVGFGSNRNPLPYVPAVQARASVERAGQGRAARLELEATGSRTTSLAATHRLGGFALVHGALRQELEVAGLPLAVDVRVRNLLGARYELVSLFPQPGRELELRIGAGPVPFRSGN